MPKGSNGDLIIVTDPKRNLYNITMTIIADKLHDEYAAFYDSDIVIAEDDNGNTFILKDDEYRLKYNSVEEFNRVIDNVGNSNQEIKTFNVITLKEKDAGTRKVFYPVIESHKNGVSFLDDFGQRRTLPLNKVELVDHNNWFKYLDALQEQVHELRQLVVKTNELIADDIKKSLENFNS